MNTATNLVLESTTSVVYNTNSMVGILFLIIVVLLVVIKTAYSEYQHRCYLQTLKRRLATPEFSVQNLFSEIRNEHKGRQLEFPFVKEIDDSYVAARYNLNADTE